MTEGYRSTSGSMLTLQFRVKGDTLNSLVDPWVKPVEAFSILVSKHIQTVHLWHYGTFLRDFSREIFFCFTSEHLLTFFTFDLFLCFSYDTPTVKPAQTMTSCLRQPILSLPKPVPMQLLLYKTTTCLTGPATTFFVL